MPTVRVCFGSSGHAVTPGCDHMLDGQPGVLAQPLHEVAPEPAALRARKRGDDDLVHTLVVDDMHGRGVRIGVDDLPVGVDARAA